MSNDPLIDFAKIREKGHESYRQPAIVSLKMYNFLPKCPRCGVKHFDIKEGQEPNASIMCCDCKYRLSKENGNGG